MTQRPQDTSAEEPDGGNLHVRIRRGPGRGNQPGLLNSTLFRPGEFYGVPQFGSHSAGFDVRASAATGCGSP